MGEIGKRGISSPNAPAAVVAKAFLRHGCPGLDLLALRPVITRLSPAVAIVTATCPEKGACRMLFRRIEALAAETTAEIDHNDHNDLIIV